MDLLSTSQQKNGGLFIPTALFDKWGIDVVGKFPLAIVVVDYFSKWVEAEVVSKNNEEQVLKFLCENIFCRFGIRRILISDNDNLFIEAKV